MQVKKLIQTILFTLFFIPITAFSSEHALLQNL